MTDRMRFSEMAGIQAQREEMESIWPLNAVLCLLGASVLGVAFYFLDTADPRPLYNPWSYAIATPIMLLVLSALLSTVVSRVVEKSMQMAFLLSVLIHLVLMVAAVNVVIFSRMWPDVLDSLAQQREELKREKLQAKQYIRLSNTTQTGRRPDYLRPVETVHQPTEVEPVDTPMLTLARSDRANLVSPSPKIELSHTPHLLERNQPATSTPRSTEQAASLSRSESSAPRLKTSAPIPESQVLELSEPAALAPSSSAVARKQPRQAAELPRAPRLPSAGTAAASGLTTPREQRRSAAAQVPRPSVNDTAVSLPRDTAGGTLGSAGPSSLPVRGMESIGSTDPVPSQEVVLGTVSAQQRRSSVQRWRASQLPELGAPQSLSASELRRLSSGFQGRSPAQLSQAQEEGAAAVRDVAGLSGADRELERSSISRSGQPGPTVVRGVDELLSQLETQADAASLDTAQGAKTSDAVAALDAAASLTLSRRGGATGSAMNGLAPPSTLLEIEQTPGVGGIAPKPNPIGGLINRRDVALDDWAPPQLESQRFARQDIGGPLAAGQVALPKPAFQQRIDRLKDRNPQDESWLAPQTELAIERGLEFLAKHQRPDGSWRLQDFDTQVLMRSDTAATGLALLSFQGAGYTHNQFKYAGTVKRAVQFLVSHQRANGDLYIPQDPASDQNAWLYSHGIASLALCEAVGMTQDEQLRPAAQKAIDFMVASQDPQLGGWRYRPGAGADTSVTGWFMMAFKSGQLAGLNVPETTFDAIEKYLAASQAPSGEAYLYRYNPYAADTPQQRHGLAPTSVMTSVGLLMRLYFGWKRDRAEMMDGADYLLAHPPENGSLAASRRDTYYWYYATQVMFHMRGERWEKWHDRLYPLLINSQVVDGELAGSWDPNYPTPDLWARYGGRLYVTTLNLLSLEVSYRHLPLYEAAAQ
ncbi:MAG: prenyltransferase/squalene oxidase repeat-containing protein [Pirellulaceae bacterium]|jgi:hypothetical protein